MTTELPGVSFPLRVTGDFQDVERLTKLLVELRNRTEGAGVGLAGVQRDLGRMSKSMQENSAAGERLIGVTRTSVAAMQKLRQQLRGVKSELDPAAASAAKLQKQLDIIGRAEAAGVEGVDPAGAKKLRLQARQAAQTKATAEETRRLAQAEREQAAAANKSAIASKRDADAKRRDASAADALIGRLDAESGRQRRLAAELREIIRLRRSRALTRVEARGLRTRALEQFKPVNQAAIRRTSQMTNLVRDLESASVLAVGPLSGLGARIRALGAIAGRSTIRIVAILGSITALVVGVSKLSAAAVRTRIEFDRIEGTLRAATGSSRAASEEFAFITKTAQDLGLSIKELAPEYAKLAASGIQLGLGTNELRGIFIGTSSAIAALRLSGQQAGNVFRAMQQMMSKGTVNAEEFTQQLGEQLPGTIALGARAMTKIRGEVDRFGKSVAVSTQQLLKMISKGEVLAKEFLPELARQYLLAFGSEAQRNAAMLQGQLNNLTNATALFNDALDKSLGISKAFGNLITDLTSGVKSLTENMDGLARSIAAVTAAIAILASAGLVRMLIRLSAGAVATNFLTKGIVALGGAALALVTSGGGLAVLAAAVAAGAFAFITFRETVDESFEALVKANNKIQEFIDLSEAMQGRTKEQVKTEKQAAREAIAILKERKKEQLEVVKGLERSVAFIKTQPASTQATVLPFRTEDLSLAIVESAILTEELTRMQSILKELDKVPLKGDELGQAFAKISKELEKTIVRFKTFTVQTDILAAGGGRAETKAAEDIVKVREIMKGTTLNKKEIAAVISLLMKVPGLIKRSFSPLQEIDVPMIMAEAIKKTRELGEAFRKSLIRIERFPKVMAKFRSDIRVMGEEIAALEEGPAGAKAFKIEQQRIRILESKRRKLVEVHKDDVKGQAEVNRLMAEFEVILDRLFKKRKEFANILVIKGLQQEVRKLETLSDAFAGAGQAGFGAGLEKQFERSSRAFGVLMQRELTHLQANTGVTFKRVFDALESGRSLSLGANVGDDPELQEALALVDRIIAQFRIINTLTDSIDIDRLNEGLTLAERTNRRMRDTIFMSVDARLAEMAVIQQENELLAAGLDITKETIQVILERTREIEKEKAAIERSKRVADSFGDAFTSALREIIVEFKNLNDVISSLEQKLINLLFEEIVTAPLKGLISGFIGQAIGSIGAMGSTGPGGGPSGELNIGASPAQRGFGAFIGSILPFLLGGQHGASFEVPGITGTDKVIPIFKATGGETVTVSPRGQASGGDTFNFNFPPGTDVGSFNRSRSSIRRTVQLAAARR